MSTSSDENFAVFLLLAGCMCLLACLGYQVFLFAQYGFWVEISAADVMVWLGSEWALHPTSWYGIHRVLSYINAGLFVFVPSTLLAINLLAHA